MRGQHELATAEVLSWSRQQHRRLQRKHLLAIEVLVQAVVVAGAVLQQQGRWPPLAGGVAALEKRRMVIGKARGQTHARVPAVGDRRQAPIETGP
jgi:hypothetical protein